MRSTGTAYVNEYDAAGRLQASTATPYGPGNARNPAPIRTSYQEDSAGRCERHEVKHQDHTNDWVELLQYDAAGRLHTFERDYAAGGAPSWRPCEAMLTVNEYDGMGRLLSSTTQAAPGHGCDEKPFNTTSYEYAADGSVRIETIDYTTDTPNDEITVNGTSTHVGHRIETRSAACADIEAQIATNTDARCSVD